MKRILLLLCIAGHLNITAQITTPMIKARFGVDADLRANFFNGSVQAGNDDWFNMNAADTTGKYVIDTTGVAAIVAGYLSDASPWPRRMASHFRTMSRPTFSVVNNRLWLDAIWVRDYHGNDTTVFTAGSDKNGMSPEFWTGGVQSVPDKNDILDVFVHIRRAGPNTTDSLWLFGGISLDNTTGNRYFDFEMYQTDIYYDRASGNWYGYGPHDGHTRWEFDAAGNILKPGDIIFSAEYQSSTLTNIEARIWVERTVWQTITPAAFNWSGQFDGASAGSTYGYASIVPKTVGAFYTGLGSSNNTWAGPFRLILQDNSLVTNYSRDQFMELSVNLSKLGLDPAGMIGGDICGTPFNRIVVKTRSSASFTAELKDFVAPTDLFLAPRVEVFTETPYICDTVGVARIDVVNPVPTSYYEWGTINGHIVGSNIGTFIWVDTPGIYICYQRLQAGCSIYATDTIEIYPFLPCDILSTNLYDFNGQAREGINRLNWKVHYNELVDYFELERSTDGILFNAIFRIDPTGHQPGAAAYSFADTVGQGGGPPHYYYRVKMHVRNSPRQSYSHVIRLSALQPEENILQLIPNPVKDILQIHIGSRQEGLLKAVLYDMNGKMIFRVNRPLQPGQNVISLHELEGQPPGIYTMVIEAGNQVFSRKVMVVK